jgi:lysophospholipase L1-like esterase
MLKHFIRLIFIVPLILGVASSAAAEVRVLVYGDSNTWGWRPSIDGEPTARYADSERWPGVMQNTLGSGYVVQVNGLIARTLGADLGTGVGPLSGQDHNGLLRLDLSLMEAGPVNLLVVMLGTNDMIDGLNKAPDRIAKDLVALAAKAKNGTVAYGPTNHVPLLVVIPPPFGNTSRGPFKELFGPQAHRKSTELGDAFRKEAERLGIPTIDAGKLVLLESIDGVHFTLEEHKTLGRAVAAAVARIIPQ